MKKVQKSNDEKEPRDLEERTFKFAVTIIKFLRKLPYSKENDVIKYQLAKCGTSIGANYEEAQGAFSKSDFKYKIGICFRESKESNYWLRIIKAANIAKSEEIDYLVNESKELKNIFGSIVKKMNDKEKVKRKK
ncbi:MAG: four helix bundle protein [Candidatus Marinimicrobia bacterium]|nr:four helix bundle protein [Candidatus Neomarinimicrobiota bacterium]MCF7828773.1 four helix bundle protein [Candidatus Neomarinimicrobiota bacterium]MCF7880690.1 four helix bundle protein [Candidatus Neomarinimicrobiota bacterium]